MVRYHPEIFCQLSSKTISTLKILKKTYEKFEETKSGSFKNFGVKLMKELNVSANKNLPDSPTRTHKFAISQSNDMLRNARSSSPRKLLEDDRLDSNHIDHQQRLFACGNRMISNFKKGASQIDVLAAKTNGDIFTWNKNDTLDPNKSQGIRKHVTHRDKLSSIDMTMKPVTGPVRDIAPTPTSYGKVNRMHMSSCDFFKW